jgi:hypothetical protein
VLLGAFHDSRSGEQRFAVRDLRDLTGRFTYLPAADR